MKSSFVHLELKSFGEDTGVIEGYGSIFSNIDSYRDIMAPGSFAKSIKDLSRAKGRKLPFLWQHKSDEPIGIIEELAEDNKGLRIKVQLNLDVQRAREAYSLIKQGTITGMSIGFQVVKDDFDSKTGIRTIKEAKLWEVSAVTFPANQKAQIDKIKSQFLEDADKNSVNMDIEDLEETISDLNALLVSLKSNANANQVVEPLADVGADVEHSADETEAATDDVVQTDNEPQEQKSTGDAPGVEIDWHSVEALIKTLRG